MTQDEKDEVRRLKRRLAQIEEFRLEEDKGIRPMNYRGPLPRPTCGCQTWGCWGCCNTEQQIRSLQGTFS